MRLEKKNKKKKQKKKILKITYEHYCKTDTSFIYFFLNLKSKHQIA